MIKASLILVQLLTMQGSREEKQIWQFKMLINTFSNVYHTGTNVTDKA